MKQEQKRRRPKGTGSVYQVGQRWVAAYRRPDGRRQREFLGSKTEAQRVLRRRLGAKEVGLPVIPNVERLTWEDAKKAVIEDFETTGKRSLDEVQRRYKLHLDSFFGGRRLIGITASDARAYAAKRQADTIVVRKERRDDDGSIITPEERKPVSAAEINRELQLLKRTLNLARKDGRLPSVPHIQLLREDNARRGFFDRAQVDALCRHLSDEIADVVRFAFITGWRIASEVLTLQWRQVDFTADEVRLDTSKNSEGRVFPMTADLRKLLMRRHAAHEKLKKSGLIEPWVFWRMVAEGRGGPKKPQPIHRFNKAWAAACVAAGLPGRIPHDLRRSAVRTFVRQGISEHTAMKLSGHKTASVFRRYDIVSPDDLRDAARKLDAPARAARQA